jgi:hypothetical protein
MSDSPVSHIPLGAKKLGCRGCRPYEQARGERVYCASCPVTLRQRDGRPWVIRTMGVNDMTVYFKATRLDGTDFRTGRVLYAVGKRVRPLPFEGEREICGRGVLHAADVPAETLIGGSWPCRLFEVTGIPFASKGHKHGFRQLTVIRELDSHLALGPNGREVAALIDRAGRLTLAERKALYAAWDVALDAAWVAAAVAARDAARNAARGTAWGATRAATRVATRDTTWGATRDTTRAATRDTARDAATALVVRDLITLEQFDVLYGPWGSVIG